MESIIRIYGVEELKEMNCYFNKENDNAIFTEFELIIWNMKVLGGVLTNDFKM